MTLNRQKLDIGFSDRHNFGEAVRQRLTVGSNNQQGAFK
ncbi:MAG: hypothetical protein [Podoviridae sp. ctKoA10]|nr:MAG: hypothetical protein [Podoviridae sp. ctKoA10]